MADAPMTVVETADFLKHATRLMTDSEREALAAFVEANPEAGEIMPETCGVRNTASGCRCSCSPRTRRTGRRGISAKLNGTR
jgi:hypothetical protein